MVGTALVVAQAFVPEHVLLRRWDDAYYYFKLAYAFPERHRWTFDGIHPTNGVQPLWAAMLCGLAAILRSLGLLDRLIFLRSVVALSAVMRVASVAIGVRTLSAIVSPAIALATAGAFLLPMAIAWFRVSGMENALYSLCLTGAVGYLHLRFAVRPSAARAGFSDCWSVLRCFHD